MLTGIVTILIMLLFCFQSGEIVPLCLLETRWLVVGCWEVNLSLGKGWRDGSFLMCVKKGTVRGYWNCMSQYVL